MGLDAKPGVYRMRWHRRLGLAAALLLVVAALSGLLINHADALGLPKQQLRAPWLLRLYGIQAPPFKGAWAVQGRWLSQWGPHLRLDERALELPAVEQVLGVFALGEVWAVADRRQVLLLLPDGRLVDTLALPPGFEAQRAAASTGTVVTQAADGRRLRIDAALSAWQADMEHAPLPWAAAQALPEALRAQAQAGWEGAGVSAERVLLDVHSGRWLGPWGVWLMDAAALVLLFLAGTGAHTMWRRWRRARARGAAGSATLGGRHGH